MVTDRVLIILKTQSHHLLLFSHWALLARFPLIPKTHAFILKCKNVLIKMAYMLIITHNLLQVHSSNYFVQRHFFHKFWRSFTLQFNVGNLERSETNMFSFLWKHQGSGTHRHFILQAPFQVIVNTINYRTRLKLAKKGQIYHNRRVFLPHIFTFLPFGCSRSSCV